MVRRRRPGTYYPYCWYDELRVAASTAEDADATLHRDTAQPEEEYAVHHHRAACYSPAKAEHRAGRNTVVKEDDDAEAAGIDDENIDDARREVVAEDSSSSFHRTAAVVAVTGSGKRVGSHILHRASDDTDAVIRASSCGEVAVVVGNGAAASRLVWVWRVVGASLRRFFGRTTLLNPQLRWKRPS